MIITELDSEIIYCNPFHIGVHDQAHWNELNLQQHFAGKTYGIMGNSIGLMIPMRYHEWSQIQENDILAICTGLANWKIKKNPLHSHDWTASDLHEVFELLPLATNEQMPFDVELEYQ
jgi:hypothetical protein